MDNQKVSSKGILAEITVKEFKHIIETSDYMADILQKLGYSRQSGSTAKKIKEKAVQFNISLDHILTYKKPINPRVSYKISLEKILVENSTYTNNGSLKRRLIREGLVENKCSICDIGAIWNNKPLTLQLDHINGVNTDNRLENIRIVCPNCHSQTDTFGFKNAKR